MAQTQTFTSSGTFTVPAGVTSITVECWGGGGSGGGNTNNNSHGGGGGAGGTYVLKVITVVPGTDYTVTVAPTKSGTSGAGAKGNSSWFGSVETIYAEGGAGGAAPNGGTASGGFGSISSSIGDIVFPGGNGANGTSAISGAGGGGAGSTGNGGNASGTTSGTGTSIGGGNGGSGRSTEGNGNSGSSAGGGGSGANIPDNSDHSGGSGAAGQVKVSWPILSVVPSNLDLGYVASGGTSAEYAYTISGINLNGAPGNISVTAPSNFEISLTSGSGFSSSVNVPYTSATLAATTVYVRFKPTAPNTNYSGNITNSGGGANIQNVAVSGTSLLIYCTPTYTVGTIEGDYISLVQLGTINNSTGALANPYYNYYSNLSTDLVSNSSYTITLRAGTYPSENNISVWIDFNQNGTFESAEKLGNVTLTANPASGTIIFTVPSSALAGTTRMRVREVWNNTALDPCQQYTYGETEDYNVNVLPWLTTGVISGSPFCAGSNVSIPFTSNGTFSPGNIFTAQLSNSSGSFTSPIVIGTLTSTTSGTISATIPEGTSAGTGYRIRVVSSNPAVTGTDNGSNLIVNTLPVAPVATGSTICVGSTATLSASGAVAGEKYKWYDAATGGTLLKTSTNETDNTYTTSILPSTTNYWVSIISATGCESSRTQATATYPTVSDDDQNAAGTNSWIGHVYNGTNQPVAYNGSFTNYYGNYAETETFDQGFGGNTNCFPITSNSSNPTVRLIYTETFSVRYRMNSTKKGMYVADLGSDDGSRLTIDGNLIYNNWTDQSYSIRPRVLMSLNGSSSLVYDFYENGGANRVIFDNLNLVITNTLNTNAIQNICLGSSGLTISGDVYETLPSGVSLSGTGYQWAYSTISSAGPWTDISGATDATYTPSATSAPFNSVATYYIIRKTSLSSANNISPNPYVATNESNIATLTVSLTVGTPVFSLGATSTRCKGAGSVIYTATATNSTEIAYTLDASSISGGNSINTATGEVTYAADWSGTSIITASATGCSGTVIATHTATTNLELSWTGAVSTNWNEPGNWTCGVIPDLATNVQIPNVTNKPILNTGAVGTTKNIVIDVGSSLTVVGNTMQISGTLTNNGTFTASAGTIEMKGSSAQVFGANILAGNTLMNLKINNPSGVTLQGPLYITGIVTALNGNLSSGGNLTLLSSPTQTALIDGTGTGNITGNVSMQRYLPSGFGYKYVSSPFQASTVNEFADDLDLAASFPALYAYDEDNHRDSSGTLIYSTGWVKYITGTDQLLPLKGYAANFGNSTSAKTIDMTGVVNNNISSTQTLYNHNRQYTKGFNLAGNPYPSPIDWDASTGWTKTNIDNAIYYFDAGSTNQYTGTYSSYILGMSSNGLASNVIPSMQGFFVHVTDGTTGTFGMDNQVRINNLSPLFHKSAYIDYRPMIRLTAAYENEKISDPTVVYFNDIATAEFDKEFDALKLMNTDVSVPNLYALTPQSVKTSINAIPYPTASETRTPLGLKTEEDNWITLMASDIENIPGGTRVFLSDEETGLIQDLQLNPEYRVNLERGTYENRFALLFSEKDLVHLPKNADTFHASILNGKLTIFAELAFGNEARLVISNLLGQVMLQQSIYGDGSHEIGQYLPTGMYVLSLYTQKGICSKKIYIPN